MRMATVIELSELESRKVGGGALCRLLNYKTGGVALIPKGIPMFSFEYLLYFSPCLQTPLASLCPFFLSHQLISLIAQSRCHWFSPNLSQK